MCMGKDMGVISLKKENIGGKNVWKTTHKKVSECKKRPNKRVIKTCVHKWKDDKQIFEREVMIEKQRMLKGIKGTKKGKSWNN
jgi:hypothetical protein